MPYITQPGSPEESILRMEHIVFDEISFVRKGFRNEASKRISLNISSSIEPIEGNSSRVTVKLSADKENEYSANISISGFCSIEENSELGKELIEKNAVAILFPYLRSELSLLTAQPETDPIVLPAMNINGMLDSAKEKAAAED